MSKRRVVITGLGIVSPVGNNVNDACTNIINGVSFQTTAPSSITENKQDMFNVFPVPATDFVIIELLNKMHNNILFYTLRGVFNNLLFK